MITWIAHEDHNLLMYTARVAAYVVLSQFIVDTVPHFLGQI